MKVIFVTGGVLSGLGKGVAASSIGHLLAHSYKVVPIKCDGYLNTDPGTINPIEHGEVFVLDDGGEVDMDFGHYERFLGIACKKDWSLTMGKVYMGVIEKERRGEYLGEDVQLIPHVTDYIKSWWKRIGSQEEADILLIEIGGTVGDLENEMFVEAARQFSLESAPGSVLFVHLTYVPMPQTLHEQKSKPSQQSVTMLRSRGINPDIILARCEEPLAESVRNKIALFSNLRAERVLSAHDVRDVYELPSLLESQGMLTRINELLGLEAVHESCPWNELLENLRHPTQSCTIAIAGKYTKLEDSYASITEALKHCAAQTRTSITVRWVATDQIHSSVDVENSLRGVDAVIVPGGFGDRGIEGKISIIQYCREHDIPFLGICYGMQLAVVEFARTVCGLRDAHSTEVNPTTKHPVVAFLPEQHDVTHKGATMRLGSYEATVLAQTRIHQLYGEQAHERHRHRYEVNPDYHETLLKHGLLLSGTSRNGLLAEFMELPGKRYFVGTQGHPELKSRLEKPAPLFLGLVTAAIERHTPAKNRNASVQEIL